MLLTPNLVPSSAQTSFRPHRGSSRCRGPTPSIPLLYRERDDARSPPNKITQGTAGRQRPCLGIGTQHTQGTRCHPPEGMAKLFCSAVPPQGAWPQHGRGAPTPPLPGVSQGNRSRSLRPPRPTALGAHPVRSAARQVLSVGSRLLPTCRAPAALPVLPQGAAHGAGLSGRAVPFWAVPA